jgi:hypothetical protein
MEPPDASGAMLMQGALADPELRYARHFALLAAAAVAVAATRYAGFFPSILLAFGWFGALHAASLTMSLRSIPGRWRIFGFIAAASLMSASVASLGARSAPFLAGRGAAGEVLVIAACAYAGAAGYGVLLRWVLRYRLDFGPLSMTALACALAACVASPLIRVHPASGTFSLAVSWWLAFSVGLFVTDRRRARS